ncbi:MAG: hypothetical protein AAGI07_02895 [Bacteroidota bacterium]
MLHFYRIVFFVIVVFPFTEPLSAQWGWSVGYVNSTPKGSMRETIQRAHGVALEVEYKLPKSPLAFGFELSRSNYGNLSSTTEYTLEEVSDTENLDGLEQIETSTLTVPLKVRNGFTGGNFSVKLDLLGKDALIEPYAEARLGLYYFSTRLSVEDPEESYSDECPKPLVSKVLSGDVSLVRGVGLGARFNICDFFRDGPEIAEYGRFYLDFSVNYLSGGAVSYMHVDNPKPATRQQVEAVTTDFASRAQPEIVNEYHTGYLYTSTLELVDFRVAFGTRF